MAKMKVVLRQPVPNLGEIGDLVTVAGGYARNYLIPRGMAVAATRGNVKQADTWKQSRAAREAKVLSDVRELKARLEAESLPIPAQAGPDGRLFGSITPADIAEALAARGGVEVDRHAIEVPDPIRHLGLHGVTVALHPGVVAEVTVEAVAQETGQGTGQDTR
jgi:large subunit ribosomal protein L9